jgi:hypothetical protein
VRARIPVLLVLAGSYLAACGADAGDDTMQSIPTSVPSTAPASATTPPDPTAATGDDPADTEVAATPSSGATSRPTTTAEPVPPVATDHPSATTESKVTPVTPTVPDDPDHDASHTTPTPDGRPLVDQALTDLRERLGDPTAEITVVSVEEVDWPDGSIGCPQPGMVYTQAIVNGTKIVLQHAGVNYAYHQGGPRDLFYCPPQVEK